MASVCEELSGRFEAMKQSGLKDVKFLFRNTDDFTEEMYCDEVMAMLDAYEAGECEELAVDDSGMKN